MLAHVHQSLRGSPGVTTNIGGAARAEAIVRTAAGMLDFSRLIAVMLFDILHFFSDAEDPLNVVGELVALLAPDSYGC